MLRHTFVVVGLSGMVGGFWVNACSVDTNGAAGEPEDAGVDAVVVDSTADRTVPDDAMEPKDAAMEASVPPRDAGDGATEAAAGCNATNCGGACCGDKVRAEDVRGMCDRCAFCPFNLSVFGSNGTCVPDCSSCDPTDASAHVCVFQLCGWRSGWHLRPFGGPMSLRKLMAAHARAVRATEEHVRVRSRSMLGARRRCSMAYVRASGHRRAAVHIAT